jgi:hypothetical protein
MLAQRKIKALQKDKQKTWDWEKVVQGCQPAQHWFKILEKKILYGQGQGDRAITGTYGQLSANSIGRFCPFCSCRDGAAAQAAIWQLLSICCHHCAAFALSAAVAPFSRLFGSCCRSAVITALHLYVVFSFNFQSQAVGCDVH